MNKIIEDEASFKAASSAAKGWTGFLNAWSDPVSYSCPVGEVMVGIYSEHNNLPQDRRWKARCLGIARVELKDTGAWNQEDGVNAYINKGQDELDFTCPQQHVMVGMKSKHTKRIQDREFNFRCAQVADSVTVSAP